MDPALEDAFDRLRRAEPVYRALHEIRVQTSFNYLYPPELVGQLIAIYDSVEVRNQAASRAERTRRPFAEELATAAERRYNADLTLMSFALQSVALQIGREQLNQMWHLRRTIWQTYLSPGREETNQSNIDQNIDRFARALASWLVFKTTLPYAALIEDEIAWAGSPLGLPPPFVPVSVQHDEDADARIDESPPTERRIQPADFWHRWKQTSNPHRDYARYATGFPENDNVLRRRLVAPELGGHPLIALVERFERPIQLYNIIRSPSSRRRTELRRLIRRIDNYLLVGIRDAQQAIRPDDPDWETVRPLLLAAKECLFQSPPSGEGTGRDAPLRRLADDLVDDLAGGQINPLLVGIFIVSLVVTLGTAGVGSAAMAPIVAAVLVGLDVAAAGYEIYLAAEENAQRARINRLTTTLQMAEEPRDLSHQAALTIAMLLLPPVVGAAVRRGVRPGLRLIERGLERARQINLPRPVRDARGSQNASRLLNPAAVEQSTTRVQRGLPAPAHVPNTADQITDTSRGTHRRGVEPTTQPAAGGTGAGTLAPSGTSRPASPAVPEAAVDGRPQTARRQVSLSPARPADIRPEGPQDWTQRLARHARTVWSEINDGGRSHAVVSTIEVDVIDLNPRGQPIGRTRTLKIASANLHGERHVDTVTDRLEDLGYEIAELPTEYPSRRALREQLRTPDDPNPILPPDPDDHAEVLALDYIITDGQEADAAWIITDIRVAASIPVCPGCQLRIPELLDEYIAHLNARAVEGSFPSGPGVRRPHLHYVSPLSARGEALVTAQPR